MEMPLDNAVENRQSLEELNAEASEWETQVERWTDEAQALDNEHEAYLKVRVEKEMDRIAHARMDIRVEDEAKNRAAIGQYAGLKKLMNRPDEIQSRLNEASVNLSNAREQMRQLMKEAE